MCRPIRFGGSLRRNRRVVQITEVKKHWTEDPEREGGLIDLMLYDARKDELEVLEKSFKDSELLQKIQRISGLSTEQMWQDIKMRGNAKKFLVDLKRKHKVPDLLEAENYTVANNKLMLMKEKQLRQEGSVDYTEILGKWKYWAKNNLLKDLISKKK